ncbi:MAG TPA: D-arabinono-1,4-lactone oxidase, partial [Lacipirellulaceae bacterium]
FVESLDLWTGANEPLRCSRNENADVFWATIGGMGLTGYIISASIRLTPIESSTMRVDYRRVGSLAELLPLVCDASTQETYSVAWIDCVASGEKTGRAVLMTAEHARRAELPGQGADEPLRMPSLWPLSVPFNFPAAALNRHSVGTFNSLYYLAHPTRTGVFTSYEQFFYPLDRVGEWNRIYGKRGFIQYQALLSMESSNEGIPRLLDEIVRSQLASFLAVLKRTGVADEGMLSFCRPGVTLALDLPNVGMPLRELTARLDRLVVDHGGRLYLAKDACTTPDMIAQMYPRLDEFRQLKARIDPQRKFVSAQAKRLGIVA